MNKPVLLRARLVAHFPELAAQPDRLRLWVEKGDVRMRAGANVHFEVRYTLTVLVEAWTQPALLLQGVVLDWLRIHQPERTAAASENAFRFEADILNPSECDVLMDIDLSEAISLHRREDGGYDMAAAAEADPLFPDDEALAANLQQIWLAGGDQPVQPQED